MRRIHDRVGGLDVHRDSVVACAELFDGRSVEVDKQTFSTTASGVRRLGEWLAEREVELVVMEATGVYWRPVVITGWRTASPSCGWSTRIT
jgi:transposase